MENGCEGYVLLRVHLKKCQNNQIPIRNYRVQMGKGGVASIRIRGSQRIGGETLVWVYFSRKTPWEHHGERLARHGKTGFFGNVNRRTLEKVGLRVGFNGPPWESMEKKTWGSENIFQKPLEKTSTQWVAKAGKGPTHAAW